MKKQKRQPWVISKKKQPRGKGVINSKAHGGINTLLGLPWERGGGQESRRVQARGGELS